MNKKKILLTGFLTGAAILGVGVTSFAAFSNISLIRYKSKASDKEYNTTFTQTKNVFTNSKVGADGTYVVTTETGHKSTEFSYKDLSLPDDSAEGWQKIGGLIGEFKNTSPLIGLKTFNIVIDQQTVNGLEQYYSYQPIDDTSIPSVKHIDIPYDGGTFSFNNEYPRYIKIANESMTDIDIKSMTLTYDCVTHRLVNFSSNDETKGTIISSKTTFVGLPGEKVTVQVKANAGYTFLGWTKEDGTILSTENPYIHEIEDEDENIIAMFDEPMPQGLIFASFKEGGKEYAIITQYVPEDEKVNNIKIPENAVVGNKILQIKKVGDSAFYHKTKLENVILPDSITVIGDSAFEDCPFLNSVHFPTSLQIIEQDGFSLLPNLNGKIRLPDGLKNIGPVAFEYDISVEWFMIPDTVESIGGRAFAINEICKIFCRHESQPAAWALDWCDGPHVYWYSEEPKPDGQHWHLEDDEPVIWQ